MTDDDKALVERLRSRVSNREMLLVDPPRPAPDRDCHYAADRIEALSAENERLREALRDVLVYAPDFMHGMPKKHYEKIANGND